MLAFTGLDSRPTRLSLVLGGRDTFSVWPEKKKKKKKKREKRERDEGGGGGGGGDF
jgi:hypothetical protein